MEFVPQTDVQENGNGEFAEAAAASLSRLGITDPLVQKLITMMEAQNEQQATSAPDDLPGHQAGRSSVKALKRENELLRRSNECLLEQSRMMAAAIGACPECWGEDPACPGCEGDGKPGSFQPHRGCFEVFVLPVVDALREDARERRRRRHRGAAAPPDDQGGRDRSQPSAGRRHGATNPEIKE